MDEQRVIEAIKKSLPSVVLIVMSHRLREYEKGLLDGIMPVPKKKKGFLRLESKNTHETPQLIGGSGFVIGSEGYVLTNRHVLSDPAADYTVVLGDDRKFPAKIMSRDPVNDVAILKIEAAGLPALPLGNASNLQLGQSVIAIGNALGIFRNTVSLGIVSGLSRAVTAQADLKAAPQELRGLIQTDAAINPGNSGGPLIDLEGRVVGVNAAIISGAQNISFAIPVNAAERDLEDIRNYGEIRRPLLGVRYVIVDENLKDKLHLEASQGAYVVSDSPHESGIIPGSPAEIAGIKDHDIILGINGRDITRDYLVQDFLEDARVGDHALIKIHREGKTKILHAVLGERK